MEIAGSGVTVDYNKRISTILKYLRTQKEITF